MSRNNALLAFAALFGLMTGTSVQAEQVSHGALEICQVIDEGVTQQYGNMEVCCGAEKKDETDDGVAIYGREYCVACIQGTDTCSWTYIARNNKQQTIRDLEKALATKSRQAPATGN